jgi:hypothetical protein
MVRCHFCNKEGGERFIINGEEFYFHIGLLSDCLRDYLKEKQEIATMKKHFEPMNVWRVSGGSYHGRT